MSHAVRPDAMPFASLLVGLYLWAVVAFFGVTLVDTAYVGVLRDAIAAENRAAVFAEVGDFLLLLMFFGTLFAALGALGSCWHSARARNLVIASAVVVVLLPPTLELLSPLLAGSSLGPILRIPGMALASGLALLGFARLRNDADQVEPSRK